MSHADGLNDSPAQSENRKLKQELLVERNKQIQNAVRLQILGDELKSVETEAAEFAEKKERLKASLAEAEEVTRVIHENLMTTSARFLDERKKSTRYKAKFKKYKRKLKKLFVTGSP